MSNGLRRGIVEEIVSSTEYRVRIVNYDADVGDPTKTLTSDLPIATVMIQPGTTVSYNVGDRVYLAFNKGELADPVIIGAMLTDDYVTEDDQIAIPMVESVIEEIKDSVEDLKVDQYYTHVKYSNDNGITFTSLYEATNTGQKVIGQVAYMTADNIQIDSTSKTVYWSIVDKDGVDCTEKFTIDTTLRGGHIKDETFVLEESRTFSDKIFDIPFSMQTYEVLYIDFKIVYTTDYDDYHYVLTTDKNTVGSTQGTYMGICTTDDPEAPDDPDYYNWTSFKAVIDETITDISGDLYRRVERNENALFGTETTEGLTDGISVSDDQVDVHGLYDKDVSFNNNKTMYIDNEEDNFTTQTVKHTIKKAKRSFLDTFTSNGHFTLIIREEE